MVHPDREYYGFKLNISRTKSTGAGSCLGCSEPACIVLNSIRLFQPDELGNNPVLVMPIESNYIKWGTPVGCPVATPVLASLVKAEAHPDRVTLEWMTEDITTARLERRTSGGAWSTLSELRAASDRRLRYEDREVAAGSSYDYRLATMAGGREIHLGETSVKVPVAVKSLALARAMGVDARTITVSLTLPKASAAKLELFDIGGRLRASRSLEGLAPGEHEVSFASSQPLGPGVYFVRLAQDGSKVSRRFSMTY
jgi:hypothetical protein